jgi:tetratricopeptide (TPR) repeat protein
MEAALGLMIGDVYRSLGELDLAETHLRRALDTRRRVLPDDDPAIAEALFNLGLLQASRAQHADAVISLGGAEEIYSASPGQWQRERLRVLAQLAYCWDHLGEGALARDARRELEEIAAGMEADPNFRVSALYEQALGLYRENKFAEAEALLHELIALAEKELGPQSDQQLDKTYEGAVLNLLGLVYLEQKKHQEAETTLRASLATFEEAVGPMHPDLIAPLTNLKVVLNAVGRHQEASVFDIRRLGVLIAGVDRAIAVEPGASLHTRRGELLISAGRIAEAAAAYDNAIEAGSTDHMAWYRAGHAHLYAGQTDDYLRVAQDMLTEFADSDRPEILERTGKLALLSTDTRHLAAATALIDKAREAAPESLAIWFDMSKALADLRAGRYQEALVLLAEPARSLTIDGQICAQLLTVMCRWHLGEREEARTLLAEVETRMDRQLPKAGEAEIIGGENWIAAHILLREARALITQTQGAERRD